MSLLQSLQRRPARCHVAARCFRQFFRALAAPLTALGAVLAMSTWVVAEPAGDVPNLVGTWVGENRTISNLKGLKSWKKTIKITEQTDRRFRGHFDYSAGRKEFFGVIYPDNISITWVASDSRGYNHGRLLDGGKRLAACYVESGLDATAGCADLVRQAE